MKVFKYRGKVYRHQQVMALIRDLSCAGLNVTIDHRQSDGGVMGVRYPSDLWAVHLYRVNDGTYLTRWNGYENTLWDAVCVAAKSVSQ